MSLRISAPAPVFSQRAAERVGRTGKVLAVDVQPEMIDGLEMMMKRFGHENIVPILNPELFHPDQVVSLRASVHRMP